MEPCVCRASIMIENNKEMHCSSSFCVCICEYNYNLCRGNRHLCICSSDHKECKSNFHFCICEENLTENCRLINMYNSTNNLFWRKHECVCYKSASCLSVEHICICKTTPWLCKKEDKHHCSCDINYDQCKSRRHKRKYFFSCCFRRFRKRESYPRIT